ncbi:glycosyltransferase family 1 protein [Brenneria roseae subsp. roseae]|uniref:glycosyltransferase family 4 protein n=1 Tax=Brenneria roseae TaxID=1509241 RepID=UPI000D605A33|nr:glycosyltransferase family 4 protein [Brenneria roseae]PWC19117.1 glycosyltransferase family 1 protein [Brenneria roseae subsp. roseae]
MAVIVLTANTSWYIYNFRKNTIKALIDNGYSIVVISPKDEYSDKIISLGADFIPVHIERGSINPLKEILLIIRFFKIYNKLKPDVVLNFTPKNNIYSTLAATYAGSKVINNIAGLGVSFNKNNFLYFIVKNLYKLSQNKAYRVFFQNETDRNFFIDNDLIPISKTKRLPGSGVDLERFCTVSAPDDGVVRFLLVARLLVEKGVVHFAEAAKILKNKYGDSVEFNLLGFIDSVSPSAISSDQINIWVNEGIVSYLGVSQNVEKEIGRSDCIVLPSFYREGVPKSLLEACAMGKPIITTDNVGCRETVVDGINGFLCTPRSSLSLLEKMESMINMTHAQRLAMGEYSRKKAENEFDEKIVINEYVRAVKELVRAY